MAHNQGNAQTSEIYVKIGSFQADITNIKTTMNTMERKIDAVVDKMTELATMFREHAKDTKTEMESIDRRIAELEDLKKKSVAMQ